MRTRRGSSFYRSEMARMIDQFSPGDYVLGTWMVIGDSLQGTVTDVNKAENKVYVAWNGGPVKQHDPDELMLSVKQVDLDRQMGEAQKRTVMENPAPEDASGESKPMVTVLDNTAKPGPEIRTRRGRMNRKAASPPLDKFVGNPELHGLDKPVSGGSNVMEELARALYVESQNAKTASHGGRRMAVYHGGPGRHYRRTRRERDEDVAYCPRCRPELVEMELQPFTRGIGIWICPECGWKISTDKVTDEALQVPGNPDDDLVVLGRGRRMAGRFLKVAAAGPYTMLEQLQDDLKKGRFQSRVDSWSLVMGHTRSADIIAWKGGREGDHIAMGLVGYRDGDDVDELEKMVKKNISKAMQNLKRFKGMTSRETERILTQELQKTKKAGSVPKKVGKYTVEKESSLSKGPKEGYLVKEGEAVKGFVEKFKDTQTETNPWKAFHYPHGFRPGQSQAKMVAVYYPKAEYDAMSDKSGAKPGDVKDAVMAAATGKS